VNDAKQSFMPGPATKLLFKEHCLVQMLFAALQFSDVQAVKSDACCVSSHHKAA
jgi:hypothetical protein